MANAFVPLMRFYIPFVVLYWLALCAITAVVLVSQVCLWPLWVALVLMLGIGLLQSHSIGRLLFRHSAEEENPLELHLPREALEELYELVERVAEDRNSPKPHEIRLAVEDVAGVFEDKDGRRILMIGCPALMLLSEEAFSGVIAHELGHFAAGDTRLSREGRTRILLMQSWEILVSFKPLVRWNPLVWILRGYHWLCFNAWAAYSRECEYRADRHEVAQVGKREAAAALVYLTVPQRFPWTRLGSIAESFAATSQPLDDLFSEQRQRLKSISKSEWEEAFRKELSVKTQRFDSHPCLRERLKAIGVSPKKALAQALEHVGPPMAEKLRTWPAIEKFLSRRTMLIARTYHQSKMEMAEIMLGRVMRN